MAKDALSLWPREHGAYAQLAVALACGLALGRDSRGVAQAVLAAGLFLASEPLLVLMGRRGADARDSTQVRAALRLLLVGSLILLSVLFAWGGAPAAHLLGLLPPALLGAVLFGLFLLRQERTAVGELVAAWAFSATAGSVVLLGGGGARRATLLAILLGGLFTLATTIVHCHLIALRRAGASGPRLAALALGLALTLCAWALARHGTLPRSAFGVFLPMTLAALWVLAAPPAPRLLKVVGWVATAGALAGGGLAVFGLW